MPSQAEIPTSVKWRLDVFSFKRHLEEAHYDLIVIKAVKKRKDLQEEIR